MSPVSIDGLSTAGYPCVSHVPRMLSCQLLTCGVCCLKSGSQPRVYLGGVPAADSDVMQALNEVERHLKAIPWTKAS